LDGPLRDERGRFISPSVAANPEQLTSDQLLNRSRTKS
jgi:hypothetical protein